MPDDTTRLCGPARLTWRLLVPALLAASAFLLIWGQQNICVAVVDGTNQEAAMPPHLSEPPVAPSTAPPTAPPTAAPISADEQAAADLQAAEAAVASDQADVAQSEAAKQSTQSNAEWVSNADRRLLSSMKGRQLLGATLHSDITTATSATSAHVWGEEFRKSNHVHVIEYFSLFSICKTLWEENQIVLGLSLLVFSGAWPLLINLMVFGIWTIPMYQVVRKGLTLTLLFLAKWSLLLCSFLQVWVTMLRLDVPLGQVRLEADWGCGAMCASVVVTYGTLCLVQSFERQPKASKKVDAKHSAGFHAVFFTLAAVSAVLLLAALTLPAYAVDVSIVYQQQGEPSHESKWSEQYTLMTAGMKMWHDSDWSKGLSVFYILLVTTLPGMFLVSAVVAWVTSPLDRESDDDTNAAMAVCNMCGRLTSLDVWLYAFGLTYLKVDELAAALSHPDDYTVTLSIEPHLALVCAAASVVCLWLMHTLAQYAHMPSDDSDYNAYQAAPLEPHFPPPDDLEYKQPESN